MNGVHDELERAIAAGAGALGRAPASSSGPSDFTAALEAAQELLEGTSLGPAAPDERVGTSLLALPTELLVHVVVLASGGGAGPTACICVARCAATSRAFCEAAGRAWAELAARLFEPGDLPPHPAAAWMGFEPPSDWRRCVASANSLARHAPRWGGAALPEMPRRSFAHSACCFEGKLYVLGGRHAHTHSDRLDVLDLTQRPPTWSRPSTSGTAPSPRRQHTASVHASGGGTLFVVGGGWLGPSGDRVYRADTHALDLTSMTWSEQPAPPDGWAYMAHSCVLAGSVARRAHGESSPALLVFGGLTTVWQEMPDIPGPNPIIIEQPVVSGQLLRFDLASRRWAALEASGSVPQPRFRHTASLIGPQRRAMAVWGGFTVWPLAADAGANAMQHGWDERCSNELFLLDLHRLDWSSPRCTGSPPLPRGGHSATVVGEQLIIIGGCDGGEEAEGNAGVFVERDLDDVTVLDLATWTYHAATHLSAPRGAAADDAARPPAPRSGHTAHLVACDGGVGVLLLGGRDYRPPELEWQDGQHLGRDEAHFLDLTPL